MIQSTRLSLRNAIDVKCKECVYDTYAPGTWRDQVKNCSGVNCPLFAVRPLPRMERRAPLNGHKIDVGV